MASPKEIRAVQDHFGLNEASAVEKDLQGTLALRAVASTNANPFRLVFGGGTCLARAYKLFPRMSEDADLKVVAKDAAGRQPYPRASANHFLSKSLGPWLYGD